MRLQRFAIGISTVNLLLLVLLLASWRKGPQAQAGTPVLRGSALELVDERGRIRSRLNIEPDGEVVFRLVDQTGTIRVKLGAGRDGSGLLLLDEATEPAVHIIARRRGTTERPTTTSVTLRGAGGQPHVIRP